MATQTKNMSADDFLGGKDFTSVQSADFLGGGDFNLVGKGYGDPNYKPMQLPEAQTQSGIGGMLQPTDLGKTSGWGTVGAAVANPVKSLVRNAGGLLTYPFYGAEKSMYDAGKQAVGAVSDIQNGVSPIELAKQTVSELPMAAYQTLAPSFLQDMRQGIINKRSAGGTPLQSLVAGGNDALQSVAQDPYQLLPYFLMGKQAIETKAPALDNAISRVGQSPADLFNLTKKATSATSNLVKTGLNKIGYEGTGINTGIVDSLQKKAINSIADNYREVAGQTQVMRKILQKSGAKGQDPAQWLAERNITPKVSDGKIISKDAAGNPTYNFDSLSSPLYQQEMQFLKEVAPSTPAPNLSLVEQKAIDYIKKTNKDVVLGDKLAAKAQAEIEALRNSPQRVVNPDGTINLTNLSAFKEGKWKQVKFDSANPYQGDVNYALGRAAKEVIQDSVPKEYGSVIEDINGELGKIYNAEKFYSSLDGRVVKGGRLGKYFTGLVGSAVASSIPFPGAPAVGYMLGESLSKMLQSNSISDITKSTILKNLQTTNPEAYNQLVKHVGDMQTARGSRLQLPAPNQMNMPRYTDTQIQEQANSAGIIKNAPAPMQGVQVPRPGQLMLPPPGGASSPIYVLPKDVTGRMQNTFGSPYIIPGEFSKESNYTRGIKNSTLKIKKVK